jgi:hypothetical protein
MDYLLIGQTSMRFLLENSENLKTYYITFGTKYWGDEYDSYDVEYDRDFPGYTVVYAKDEDSAITLFEKEFSSYEVLNIREVDEETAKYIKSRIDYVDFYK